MFDMEGYTNRIRTSKLKPKLSSVTITTIDCVCANNR